MAADRGLDQFTRELREQRRTRRYINRRVYREQAAREYVLECTRAPPAWAKEDTGWILQYERRLPGTYFPFVLVEEHTPPRRTMSVTIVYEPKGPGMAPGAREYLADSVSSFREACALAYPRLRALDAASRLTGVETLEVQL